MGWREWTLVGGDVRRNLTRRKRQFFVVERHVEDVTQDEKHVPDLVESIMSQLVL